MEWLPTREERKIDPWPTIREPALTKPDSRISAPFIFRVCFFVLFSFFPDARFLTIWLPAKGFEG